MQYLVASGVTAAELPQGCQVVAVGEAIAFEQPWSFGAPLIARVDDGADLSNLTAKPGVSLILVEGAAEPDDGQAFAIGAHIMHDPEGFKPYAAGVPDVIKHYGCNYLARGGWVSVLAGAFAPTRVVLMQFPDTAAVASFYFSDGYAPLLPIRLATTEPRFVLIARSGRVPAEVRRVLAARLSAQI